MPAARFFALYRAMKPLRNRELVDACHVSRAAAVSNDGFKELVSFFHNLEMPGNRPPDVVVPEQEKKKLEPLRGEAARQAMFATFARDHRVASNGRRRPGG